jgi:catechol 2,3-dioxygenase-like lactoylglutathione lyase family enzyme
LSIKFGTTTLFVNNVKESKRFYNDILGQSIESEHGLCIGFKHGFSIWQIQHANRTIFNNHTKYIDNESNRKPIELYFETDDIFIMFNKIKELKLHFIHEIIEQGWGQKSFRILDPDGYIVEIAEEIAGVYKRFFNSGMTLEEISLKTSTDQNEIKNLLGLLN